MARIRTLKPEFWTDEKLSLLDPLTRLVFLALVSLADDYGRLVDNVKLLDGQIFPHTDDSVLEPLATLASLSRILRYRSKAGQQCLQIIGWTNHQKVDHPGKEVLPAPTKEDYAQPVTGQRPIAPPRKSSRKSRENVAQVSRSDLGPTTNDLGASPAGAGGWPGDAAQVWKAVAPIPIPQIGRALKPVVAEYGWPDTKAGLECYIELNEGKARNPQWFANDSVRWIKLGKMPMMDPVTGQFTERGEMAKRAALRLA